MFSRMSLTVGISLLVFCCQSTLAGDRHSGGQEATCQPVSGSCDVSISTCCTRSSCGGSTSAFAKWLNGDYWPAFTSWEIKPGNRRVLGDGLLMVPLYQDCDTMFFADVRGQTDDNDAREGNWGLALRRIVDDRFIWGAYGFYDLRYSENQNYFNQGMMGMELLAINWEARVNGYIPDTGPKAVGGAAGATAALVGNNIYVMGGWERAYYGVDAEVGTLLHCWGDNADIELRGFAGGFHFDNNAAGFPSVSGPSGRLEVRSYDLNLLGCGSRLALGCEVTWDEVRDTQVFGFARIGIPIGPGSRRVGRLSRLRRRMLDRIERDVDVVTNARGSAPEPALFADTGQPIGDVTVIDADTADVPGAVAGAGVNSTVIADGTKGQIDVDDTIILQDGQTVRGAGFGVLGQDTGLPAVFGSRPTVNGTNTASNDVLEIADNSTIRDMNVTGGLNGIYGNGVAGFAIRNNSISGGRGSGVRLDGTNNGDIVGNIASGTNRNGFYIESLSGGTVSGNTSQGNGIDGFYFWGAISSGTVSDNTASGNQDDGFVVETLSGGTLSDNTLTGNRYYGLSVRTLSGGTVSGNTATGNRGPAISIGTLTAGVVSGNTATGNNRQGFRFGTISGGTVTGNTSSDNLGAGGVTEGGFEITDFQAGTMSDNTASGNTRHGFFVNAFRGTAQLNDNYSADNGGEGYNVAVGGGAPTATNNTGQNNTGGNNSYTYP